VSGDPLPGVAEVAEVVAVLRSAVVSEDPQGAVARFSERTGGMDAETLAAILLAVGPDAETRHRRLGIPPAVTACTLADVTVKLSAYGASVDRPWLVGLLRGDVLGVGRLQFEREPSADGRALHIPEGPPLTPRAVDDSLAMARRLLGDHGITCTSWLFDPALLALSAGSNIARFRSRFEIGMSDPGPAGSAAAARFVFRRPLQEVLDPALVTPTTSIERIVVSVLRSGRHWSEPRAVLRRA
jgi:hypothetical protein